jgi:hypothetical protein
MTVNSIIDMKAKLIRRDNGEFYLIDENNKITSHHHLSKQNCDEIFGVIDEDKKNLYYYKQVMNPYETGGQSYTAYEKGFIEGFNKAMELNKDKLFTLEDMKKAIQFGEYNTDIESFEEISEEDTLQFIESLQQPTEIEVEIEMETCSMNPLDLDCDEIIERIKLDLSECLILKKI